MFATQHFSDRATDLGTTLFAFVKAQVLQARRAEDGRDTKPHRRTSSAEAATALVTANLAGGSGVTEVATAEENGGESGGSGGVESSTSGASPQAWAKLNYLTYTRHGTSENMPFPAGMAVLLKALSNVLNHCVGTGDLAVGACVCLGLTSMLVTIQDMVAQYFDTKCAPRVTWVPSEKAQKAR